MAHDDESRIRAKVRGLEAAPAVIDRERLWGYLHPNVPAASRFNSFYLAAACLALIGALVFYSLQETYRHELALRIAETELLVAQVQQPVPHVRETLIAEEPCPTPTQNLVRKSAPPVRLKIVSPLQAEHKEAVETPRETEVVAQTVTLAPEPQPTTVVAPVPPLIIGGAWSPSAQKDNRRLTFSLFKREDRQETQTPTPVVILAGVNN